ncbi:ATP-binding protein [Micromonospora sp. NBC_00821]|uniref:ATP-binding protein n=1 Tax=Micromonospora sp. NBC_00821 TaxID=2975977 RepID=UPI002ED457A1|nr:ATP-binding protein [Micromonospora sp. NBC_00821]
MTTTPIRGALADWQDRVARHATITDTTPTLAELQIQADREELAAIQSRQAANRAVVYTRRRPSRYATAAYDRLRLDQDPAGKVSRWWDNGPRTLVLAGPTRTGKTTAAYAIANAVHHQEQWVMVWTAADLSAALKPDSSEPLAYDYATTCALLVIDDLGRERVTDWWLEQLQRIVDHRCSHERRLIVTTNTAGEAGAVYDELSARYGHPVVERLLDGGGLLVLDGPPVRHLMSEW